MPSTQIIDEGDSESIIGKRRACSSWNHISTGWQETANVRASFSLLGEADVDEAVPRLL